MTEDIPWLKKTNQSWKANIFLLLAIVAVYLFINAIFLSSESDNLFISLMSFLFIAILAFFWLCFSIKCPETGYRPVWFMIRTLPSSQWANVLFYIKDCPTKDVVLKLKDELKSKGV